ncbi:10173_t:CDS:2 [Funneliformis geosporum]|uniref:10173_t:CDS:1 n=1 Tax=Funneliformis geosporum TaxID=1117311 RepID=A0A9W4X043_9GLOM|nr:10173_t:CDS:2 [Funneliformis geosporum]
MAGINFDDLVNQYNYYKYRLFNYLENPKERNLFDAAFQTWEDLKDTVENDPPEFEEEPSEGGPPGEGDESGEEIPPSSPDEIIKDKKIERYKKKLERLRKKHEKRAEKAVERYKKKLEREKKRAEKAVERYKKKLERLRKLKYKRPELKYLKKLIGSKKTPFEIKGLAQVKIKTVKSEIQQRQIALLKKTKKRLLFRARKSSEFKLPYQERKSIGRGGYKYKNVEVKHLKREAKALYRTLSKIKNKISSPSIRHYQPPKTTKPVKSYMYTLEGEREGGKYIPPSKRTKYLKNYEEGQNYIITRIPPKEYQRKKEAYEERFYDMYEDSILRGKKGALKGGGRPKTYKTPAEKQRAYRRRKKQK